MQYGVDSGELAGGHRPAATRREAVREPPPSRRAAQRKSSRGLGVAARRSNPAGDVLGRERAKAPARWCELGCVVWSDLESEQLHQGRSEGEGGTATGQDQRRRGLHQPLKFTAVLVSGHN